MFENYKQSLVILNMMSLMWMICKSLPRFSMRPSSVTLANEVLAVFVAELWILYSVVSAAGRERSEFKKHIRFGWKCSYLKNGLLTYLWQAFLILFQYDANQWFYNVTVQIQTKKIVLLTKILEKKKLGLFLFDVINSRMWASTAKYDNLLIPSGNTQGPMHREVKVQFSHRPLPSS